jgi:uncharacterized repeat protein (TIGR01451 family)
MKTQFILLFWLSLPSLSWAQFSYPVEISTNTDFFLDPKLITPADLDNDGDLDILAYSNRTIVWYENYSGKGHYTDPHPIVNFQSGTMGAPKVFDVDGDSDLDLLFVKDGFIVWYEQFGSTHKFVGPHVLSQVPETPGPLHIADLDGDMNPDILFPQGPNAMGWLRNLGIDGQFSDFIFLLDTLDNSPLNLRKIYTSDADDDGDIDIFFYDQLKKAIYLMKNEDGMGSFGPPVLVGQNDLYAEYFSHIDLDNDNDLDLLVTFRLSEEQCIWYENIDGQGTYVEKLEILQDSSFSYHPVPVDLDLDGQLEFLVHQFTHWSIYSFDSLSQSLQLKDTFYPYYGPSSLHTPDLNGDALPDILFIVNASTVGENLMLFFPSEGNKKFGNPVDIASDANSIENTTQQVITSDVNQDGLLDLVCAQRAFNDDIIWYENDRSRPNKFKNPRIIPKTSTNGNYIWVDFADFDNDGDEDLLGITQGINYAVVLHEHLEDGSFAVEKTISTSNSAYPINFAYPFDIDADGFLDVLLHTYDSGGIPQGIGWVRNIGGTGQFSPPIPITQEIVKFNDALMTDFDQDGDIDILMLGNRLKINGDKDLDWLENIDGAGSFSLPQHLLEADIDISSINLFAEDMNGDGSDEFLVVSTSKMNIYKNDQGQLELTQQISFPIFTVHVWTVDLDQDQDKDLLFDWVDNYFWIANLNGLSEFSDSISILTPGIADVILTVADFDQDKDSDIISYGYSPDENWEKLFFRENFRNFLTISGLIYYDADSNGIFDNQDFPMHNGKVIIEPDSKAQYTSPSGEFLFAVDSGLYQLHFSPLPNFSTSTPPSLDIVVSKDSTFHASFGVVPVVDILQSTLSLTSAPTRCGFDVPFWVHFQNTGTIFANGLVTFRPDSLVSFVSAEPPPDSSSGALLFWKIEDLPPSHSGTIQIILTMPDENFEGEQLSMSAEILLQNDSQADTFFASAGYRPVIACAIDPNDKLVEPNIPDYLNYTLFGDTIKYTVRFQNTGTDTAFTVRIEDFLDPDLDWSSLRLLGSSHPYEASLDLESGKLSFLFENILLPDSSTNEAASHGLVHFSLKHEVDLPEKTLIRNTAGIFFDYNAPIITNTVENILVSELPLAIEYASPLCPGDSTATISLPLENSIFLSYQWSNEESGRFLDSLPAGSYSLTVTTISGSQIDTSIFIPDPPALNLELERLWNNRCYGFEDGLIEVRPYGGNPEISPLGIIHYDYQWGNGVNEAFLENLPAADYLLTVTDGNGCSIEKTFTVTQPDSLYVSDYSLEDVSCFGYSDGEIWVQANGGIPDYQYKWNNGIGTTSNPQNLEADVYTLTLTDSQNCSFVSTLEIKEPEILEVISFEIDSIRCFNINEGGIEVLASGGTAPYYYNWDSGDTLAILEQLLPGTYTLTLTDSQGCFFIDSFSVTSPPELLLTVFSSPETGESSDGTATVIPEGGTPPYMYLWSQLPNQDTSALYGLPAGNYWVTVTDTEGCAEDTLIEVGQLVSFENPNFEDLLKVRPNPSRGPFFLEFTSPIYENSSVLELRIHDSKGELIHLIGQEEITKTLTIHLEPGWYLLSLLKAGQSIHQKKIIVIEN